jgi:hypothetical protein
MSDGGKGSSRRPMSVSQQEWDSRWDAIFCRDEPNIIKGQYVIDEQCPKCATELKIAPGIGPFCPNKDCDVKDNISLV